MRLIENITRIPKNDYFSWSGQGWVLTDNYGDMALQSFNTIVLMTVNGVLYRTWKGYSKSTMVHIKKAVGINSKQYYELPYKDISRFKKYEHFRNAKIRY